MRIGVCIVATILFIALALTTTHSTFAVQRHSHPIANEITLLHKPKPKPNPKPKLQVSLWWVGELQEYLRYARDSVKCKRPKFVVSVLTTVYNVRRKLHRSRHCPKKLLVHFDHSFPAIM